MWEKNYKDYPPDTPWMHDRVESGKGIVGCEMHEINGWQEALHKTEETKPGLLSTLWALIFRRQKL